MAGIADEAAVGVKTQPLLMFGAIAVMLPVAATNVAWLLHARGVHRRRETAIRSALAAALALLCGRRASRRSRNEGQRSS